MRKSNWDVRVNGTGTPVTDIISRFWMSRGIGNPEAFLEPKGNILPVAAFKYMKNAVDTFRVAAAQPNAKFLIYADVDADGCSSAAIVYHYLTTMGLEAEVYINKEKEHGIKEEFFENDFSENCVIVVDSINDTMEQYERIWAQNKSLIILDHHVPNDIIRANAERLNLVSSALDYPNPHLSGSGVAWKFVLALDYTYGTYYADNLIDLAAVGIIADVCSVGPESMENREICSDGFSNVQNVGLRTLLKSEEMNADAIAYTVAPLVNAANRMNANRYALDLFLTDSEAHAKQLIKQLTKIKDEQKAKVSALFDSFDALAEPQKENSCYYFIVDDTVGNLGGLLATKAADKWNRPCMVLHERENDYAGSMRAVGCDDFSSVVNSSSLGTCAGHENSAGVVIPKENFEALKIYVENALKDITFSDTKIVDIKLDRMQVTPLLIGKLREINRISGPGFAPVKVLIEGIKNYQVKQLSQGKHLCIEVPDMKFLSWNFNRWDDVVTEGELSAIGVVDESFFAGKHTNQMIMEDYIFQKVPKVTSLW